MASFTGNKGLQLPSPLSILGVFIASIIGGIVFSEGQALNDLRTFFVASAWSFVIWLTQYYGNGYIFYFLDQKWPWLDYPIKRLLIGFLALVLYSFVAILIVNISFYRIISGEFPDPFMNWAAHNGKIAVSISLIISTIMTTIGFFRSWKQSVKQEEHLKVEMLDHKYKTLLNQVNPHFLFNSLNVLSSLVYDDQDLAVKFIRQLSKIYRYTLENRERDMVSLQEERRFIDSYVFLLKIRFEAAMEVDVDIPDDKDQYLLPMALQILVENAIKHNKVSIENPLKVKIYVEDDYIVVSNNLQRPSSKEESFGFGLDNIKKRLDFLTDRPLIIEEDGYQYIAKVPILTILK